MEKIGGLRELLNPLYSNRGAEVGLLKIMVLAGPSVFGKLSSNQISHVELCTWPACFDLRNLVKKVMSPAHREVSEG